MEPLDSLDGSADLHAFRLDGRLEIRRRRREWVQCGSIPLIGIQTHPGRDLYLESRNKVQWAAVASQYFCTIVSVPNFEGVSVGALRYSTHKANHTPVMASRARWECGHQSAAWREGHQDLHHLRWSQGAFPPERLGREAGFGSEFWLVGFISEILLAAMNWLHSVLFQQLRRRDHRPHPHHQVGPSGRSRTRRPTRCARCRCSRRR